MHGLEARVILIVVGLDAAASLLARHSFPTRRSSDLPGQQAVWLHGDFQGHVGGEAVLGVEDDEARRRLEEDRKSTRLNSSHTVISYAVFCLKKKKTNTQLGVEKWRTSSALESERSCT